MGEKRTPYKPVTIERIKAKEKYKHLTDDQAQQVIDILRQFAFMTCELLKEIPDQEHGRFIDDL